MNAAAAIPTEPYDMIVDEGAKRRIRCPVCNSSSRIRSSQQVTPLVKEYFCQCDNVDCGLTWKAQMSVIYALSPSAMFNPEVDIPLAPPEYRRKMYPPGGRRSENDDDTDQLPMFGP